MHSVIAAILVVTACAYFAQKMAVSRGRAPKLWMQLAASLGPLPLAILALLPKKRQN